MSDLNIALTESSSLRSAQISRYGDTEALSALQKAKGLVMAVWQGTNIATTQQIAEYYEVNWTDGNSPAIGVPALAVG